MPHTKISPFSYLVTLMIQSSVCVHQPALDVCGGGHGSNLIKDLATSAALLAPSAAFLTPSAALLTPYL